VSLEERSTLRSQKSLLQVMMARKRKQQLQRLLIQQKKLQKERQK
jgi:hypothetical protein